VLHWRYLAAISEQLFAFQFLSIVKFVVETICNWYRWMLCWGVYT
jgi:hypothetical protein